MSVWFRFILHAKKTAFVVEHDFIMATYLADRVIMFEGKPSIETVANMYVQPVVITTCICLHGSGSATRRRRRHLRDFSRE